MPQVQGIKAAAVVVYRPASAGITQFEDPVTTGRFVILGNPKGSIAIEKYDRIPHMICPRIGEPVFIEKKFQLFVNINI